MPNQIMHPSLSQLLPLDKIPNELEGIKEALVSIFDDIFVKNLIANQSYDGSSGFYSMTLTTYSSVGLDIPIATDLRLVLNPTNLGNTEIPVSFDYSWIILKYINDFNYESFDNAVRSVLDILFDLAEINKKTFLNELIYTFYSGPTSLDAFVAEFNTIYPNTIVLPNDPDASFDKMLTAIIEQISKAGADLIQFAYDLKINIGNEGLDRLKKLFARYFDNIETNIKEALELNFNAAINEISVGLQFPHKWLVPVYTGVEPVTGLNINDPLPDTYFSYLKFEVGSLEYSSKKGFIFNSVTSFSLNRSMIGKTGLIAEFEGLKVDLSKDKNIPEADQDGRDANFLGVYAEYAAITLPKKWFKKEDGQTLKIAARNLLVGTGGISGTIILEAENNTPAQSDDYFWFRIGGDNGFRLGFNQFDITFKQNAITGSNIKAALQIPKFKNQTTGLPLEIVVVGHLFEDGDFNLTASVEGGIEANLFNFVHFNFLTLELGKQDDDFYIGTSCEIWFTNAIMTKIIGDQKIILPSIRIYSDGSIEIVGGNAFIPVNISLDLGPVDVSVTGIHFGSYQQNGRKYNYWGFDGAISIDPLGLDARGEGIKYYYTVDNDQFGGVGDSFIRIQTITVDLIIPGSATPAAAMAIIHGMISIPEPGDSPEYIGEVSIKLPKAKIAGGAAMKFAPKSPAFIIDAYVDLPAPIPIGPVGIYGFRGLLGYRYIAQKEAVGLVSGVNTWYDYYKFPPRGIHISKFSQPNKTKNYDFPFSIGAGAVLGTSFDSGTIISVRAMLVLSLPTLFMIDGRASIISARLGLDATDEPPFFAFVAWGDNSIEMGMGADFKLPQSTGKILSLQAQVEARFMFNNASAWYINIGTRQNPNTATVFKDLINLRALSYLMLSAQGIEAGARADFELKKNFFGIKVRLYAFVEIGGRVSFERPQIGGYVHLGGGIEVNVWRVIYIGFDLNAYLSAEAVKPFLIFAKLEFKGKIKIVFVKIKFNIKLQLKWEISNEVDTSPVPALPFLTTFGRTTATSINRTNDLVKGVHMLTNDTYDLNFLGTTAGSVNVGAITQIIPLDTYIDIKTTKGLIPNAISNLIGGYTSGPANYNDMIPPQKTVAGGYVLRQVKHQYSIEKVEIFAWNGGQWIPYHPFKALFEAGPLRDEVNGLKVGYWQRNGEQYDTVRLMATNPFSYLDAGEPGWFIPEHYGITPSTLFCQTQLPDLDIVDVLNKNVGTTYYYNGPNSHYINGAYFSINGGYDADFPIQNGGITIDTLRVINDANPHGFAKSLGFSNYNSLVITLTEDAVELQLKITSTSQQVRIGYYRSYISPNFSQAQFELISEITVNSSDLNSAVYYSDPSNPVIRIIIEPLTPLSAQISAIQEQIEALFTETYADSSGVISITVPDNRELYARLQDELEKLLSVGCSNPKKGEECKDKDEKICALYEMLLASFCFVPVINSPKDLDIKCYQKYISIIKSYEKVYPGIIKLLQPYYDQYNQVLAMLIRLYNGGAKPDEIIKVYLQLYELAQQLLQTVYKLGNCGCQVGDSKCITSFQELRSLSMEDYEYSILIPGSAAQMADQQAMQAAVEHTAQPIWRPNTKYHIHFQLKDNVDDGASQGLYDYYYGFRTTGGVGHYTENDANTGLNSLSKYIDYNRSYPNADGNLLQAKPLFWGHYQCKITLYFTTPFTYHMLKDWPEYDGMPLLKGNINIKIKDPVSDQLIPYPLPASYSQATVPVPVGNGLNDSVWVNDNDPRIPVGIQLLNNLIASSDIPCQLFIGDPLAPASYAYSVKLTNLKPQKLYTALVYNAFDANSNGSLSDAENAEVHNFVFQTSRYENFAQQVNSYLLTDGENLPKPAVFRLTVDLGSAAIANAYAIVSGTNVNILPALSVKYSHAFDRVLEGIFLFRPLEFPATTEFNFIRNSQTGNTVALLIRNPEPFNNPKMPVSEVQNTIAIVDGANNVNPAYHVLYSKDYSQVLIMKTGNVINDASLQIRFQYKLWNGSAYTVQDTVNVTVTIN